MHLPLVLAFGLLAFAVPAAAERPSPALADRLDAVVERAVEEGRVVGAVVLVARDGETVYRRAAGLADREAGRQMTEDAIFRLASLSKPIVTAAALRLVEQGALRLDDPVTRWLPDFRPRLPDGSAPVITVHHLLTHTSGLSYSLLEPADSAYRRLGVSDGLDSPGFDLAENLRRLASAPLAFPPGTAWRYSLGIDVLGAVVAEAGGDNLPDIVEALVTRPLGMRDTGFLATDPSRLTAAYVDGAPAPQRMGENHVLEAPGLSVRFAPGRALDPEAYPSGGAGMVGTADDFLAFLEAIRSRKGLLADKTLEAMTTNRSGFESSGPGWGFGYGWAVLTDPEAAGTPQSAGTISWGGVYGHSWFVDPAEGLSVVAMTNTAIEGMSGAFTREIRDAVYDRR